MSDYQYIPRYAANRIARASEALPVVVLMGARQTGKSTLVRSEPFLADRLYLNLDDPAVRERAVAHPDELIRSAPRLILDEVQREPDVILAIKRAVDADRPRVPGRFVLTGSANLLLMKRVADSLAGRASYVPLWPFTRREKLGLGRTGIWTELLDASPDRWFDLVRAQDAPAADWRNEVRQGGYPTPALELKTETSRADWFDGYVTTYLERDLQDLASIDNLVDFRRLMRAAAHRIGGLVNQAEIGRDLGIPRPTVGRYLNLLETSYQLVRLEPYSVNRTKRLIKSPKLYWSDPALALHLSGAAEPTGFHLENIILADLLAWRAGQVPRPEILYWRTTTDHEVDFVVEHPRGLLGIEVKATARVGASEARHLSTFRDEYADHFIGGLVLYDGNDVFWIGDRILAAPWWQVV